ncbi:MAG: phosphotransferase [Clostridia bacterium]
MLQEFYDIINLKTDLYKLSKIVCEKYNLGKYLSDEIILVRYEDFNYILTIDKGKFCIKVFNKDRTFEDVKKYIDRIKLANSLKEINTPKVYECNEDILCEIKLDEIDFRLCVFEYVDGKSFYDLNEIPTENEIKDIISQMANIHNAKLESEFIYDKWTITNFIREYEDKEKYLDSKYKKILFSLSERLKQVKLDKLPMSFVHGDIISSNVMKDDKGKLWIIDFAISNYLPRIVDLAVTSCNLCLNPDSKDKTIQSTRMILEEYQKYNQLTDYELECFPLFYDLANASGILQISCLSSMGDMSEEDEFWLTESEKGLGFSTPDFWQSIIQSKTKNGYMEMWDNWSEKRGSKPVYDLWLEEYEDILTKNKEQEMLDLGCGIGADTLYLLDKGYSVLSCDFSTKALESIKKYIPNSKTMYLDMMKSFPFEDCSYKIIIADLSLHYFDNETTIHIMKEIKRVLKENGVLLARVASVNDFNFGAGLGEQLEKNFYFEGDYTKRFFDEEDVNKYFGIIGEIESRETSMTRQEDEYLKPKALYQVKVK